MIYVCRMFTLSSAIYEAKKFAEENSIHVAKVDRRGIPICVEFVDGNKYLFMTTFYYEKIFKLGRRKGIDYECI